MFILLKGQFHSRSSPSITRNALSQWHTLEHLAIAMAAVVVPTMLPFKLEPDEGTTLHNHQRVLRQLLYDQGAVTILGDSKNRLANCSGWQKPTVVEARFIGNGKDSIL